MKGGEGEDRSWPAILQSFEDLAGPVVDGRWGGVLLFFSSDLEYVCVDLGLRHFGARKMCFLCDADTADTPHNDFTAGAAWRRTVFTNGQFLRHIRQPRHVLTAHAWWNRHTYRLDMLHVFDHHGVASVVVGNILWEHLRTAGPALPGRTQEDRLEFLNGDIRAFYSLRRVSNRLPSLRLTNFHGSAGFVELTGRVVKAAKRHGTPAARPGCRPEQCATEAHVQGGRVLERGVRARVRR